MEVLTWILPPVGAGLVAAVGVLWKRLTKQEDKHERAMRKLIDRYHEVLREQTALLSRIIDEPSKSDESG